MNGGNDSVWNWDHRWDRILYRFSYMFSTQTAEDLYRRWMGYKVDPNQFVDGSYVSLSWIFNDVSYCKPKFVSYL